ncbi:hypothetical protein J4Q44_G00043380 [Coregonus suidteri]|uniref:Uncharacterized protein n=1 Tax=Coregonus suidteri TaxID=861788 RepID=A0AAN8R4K4_9TELE
MFLIYYFFTLDGDERSRYFLIIAVICILVASGLAIFLKKRRTGHSRADSPERKQDDIQYAEITHIKPADNQERTGIQGLESLRDKPNLTLVYDTIQLHRMAAIEDVNTV